MSKTVTIPEKEEHLFLCDGAKATQRHTKQNVHRLKTGEKREKDSIHLDIGALRERLTDNLPAVMKDLLEIATFVYAAGQLTTRGGLRELDYGNKWHREFDLAIPVREFDTWNDPQTKELLEDLLSFVAGEHYTFHFSNKQKENPEFLGLQDSTEDPHNIKEVVLFSGGMDSFAGAVDEIVSNNKKIALISHCSEPKMRSLQKSVYDYLTEHCTGPTPLHVPVHIYKGGNYITKDTNQRSRSFLFASLAAIVAKTVGLNRALFYENGIISCNLPFDAQTLQARRTRSTHPRFLSKMSELIKVLTTEDFRFENPYLPMTRTDIVKHIVKLQHPRGISKTRSCAKSRYSGPRHDGVCSQCVDRRFATIAASCLEYDPQDDYQIDIFLDDLDRPHDRTMALGYVYLSYLINHQNIDQFYEHFSSDLIELINHMGTSRSEALKHIYNLYRNHARQVRSVIQLQIKENPNIIEKGKPVNCLLCMVAHQKHQKVPVIAKQKADGVKKHGGGQLNQKVKNLLDIDPTMSAPQIAKKIGNNTSAPTIRQTEAWKNRKK